MRHKHYAINFISLRISKLCLFVLLFQSGNLLAVSWDEVYQAKSKYEKHVKIVQLAQLEDSRAQFVLSHHYRLGEHVQKDGNKANEWLFKSANNGYAEAEYMLASSYNTPRYNFSLDYEQSVMWLKRAAKQGHLDAQYELGEQYHVGLGVERDLILSYIWLNLASRSNRFLATRSRLMVKDEMTDQQIKTADAQLPEYFKRYADNNNMRNAQ
ncbi:hypothetical protein MNBD_GAMMA09-2540 [hydrothermal vent metagenome]|uniref:Sel1 repeat family protein n=1 Tax=hydrothermal vent metagenome TaxID=652676 RepID=A0A3B0XMR6_9ZZZZ